MKIRERFKNLMLQEDLNFLVTNRIPRITLTLFIGWWSKLKNPLIVKGSIAVWKWFSDLDLSEAKQENFASLHECFIRELKPGLRPVNADPSIVISPSDAIVGACGEIKQGVVIQAKGFPYTLESLLGSSSQSREWINALEGGRFITLRLTSSMYHRFHSPHDAKLKHVTYISGDTWNVNPIALSRVEQLFCKNERAVLQMQMASGAPFLMVPVAAVLVASMRFHALDVLLHLRYKGPNEIPCDASYAKGEEMGWFQHGSTILMFVPKGFSLVEGIETGKQLRMGEALLVN